MRGVKRAKGHAHMQCPLRLLQPPFRDQTKPRATVLGLLFETDRRRRHLANADSWVLCRRGHKNVGRAGCIVSWSSSIG